MVHDAGFAEVDLEVLDFEERHGFGLQWEDFTLVTQVHRFSG
jgi:hypothetical protein